MKYACLNVVKLWRPFSILKNGAWYCMILDASYGVFASVQRTSIKMLKI